MIDYNQFRGKMSKTYSLSDQVWSRVVQIVQEALLMGVDIVDLLRMIRVSSVENSEQLELSPEYVTQVETMHSKWLERAKELQAKKDSEIPDTQRSIFN